MDINTVISLCSFLGGSGVIAVAGKYIYKRIKLNETKTESVCLGVQALLRDRLYQSYNYCVRQGYAPLRDKENFENMWLRYHNLGANGVMDGVHSDFMELPTEPQESEAI